MARAAALWLVPFLALVLAGCGGGISSSGNGTFSVSPGTASIDTNCTGCNTSVSGAVVEQFSATFENGSAASVHWSLSGGDKVTGAGTITSSGQYVPPNYLTADQVAVTVTATSTVDPTLTASATLTVTPGFLQPLSPENVALGANGTVSLTGYIAEAGGTTKISYAVAAAANGTGTGLGSLGVTSCNISTQAFTSCTVTYSAPSSLASTTAAYVVGTVGASPSKTSTVVLLNTPGINSNPVDHQQQLNTPVLLGSSGGNNFDYDSTVKNGKTVITDCCGGTLGALVKDSSSNQYILSNNHVLARSDQAKVGDMIVQPALIEENCIPYGQAGAQLTPVASLTGWVPINSSATDVDAAIAKVESNAVNSNGSILELGTKQSDGTLAAAAPGVTCSIPGAGGAACTQGKGETATLQMAVAKSGRTTGLTCGSVSALALNIQVHYYADCAETKPYYTKTFTNQIGVEGNQFSDSGDSGSLIVDTANAEPVGLLFAGGPSSTGVGQAVANPVGSVLGELSTYAGTNTSYSFVGGADHAVSCLNYGNATATAAQAISLTSAELDRTEQAMVQARMLVNSSSGILGVAMGKSSDRAGAGAVIVYVKPGSHPKVPDTIGGVRTTVIPASQRAVSAGVAPQSLLAAGVMPPLPAATLRSAIAVKQQLVHHLMASNPAFFGVGVGQSLDDPQQAALVIYVDRSEVPASLPPVIGGLRTRYILMDRLHVTRSYLSPIPARSHCMPHAAPRQPDPFGLLNVKRLPGLHIY
ncbi:MAG: hypothetical protein ACLGSH_10600 [Acidobacteriota bacterium]